MADNTGFDINDISYELSTAGVNQKDVDEYVKEKSGVGPIVLPNGEIVYKEGGTTYRSYSLGDNNYVEILENGEDEPFILRY
ncbi:MAG: hypothetical protein N4A47_03855 [Clostridia bacterium]|jgi:hypothetical protein|nr:hypothetical protein [Clostridia bacterium]